MQAQRTREMVMYRKYRVWDLEHWALSGPPCRPGPHSSTPTARRPVYAVWRGPARRSGLPVDAFCARHRHRPACCRWWTSARRPARLLPACTTTGPWMRTRARAPAAARQRRHRVSLWGRSRRSCRASPTNSRAKASPWSRDARPTRCLLLAPHEHVAAPGRHAPVLWLPAHALGSRELDAKLAAPARLDHHADAHRRSARPAARRAREWLRQQAWPACRSMSARGTLQGRDGARRGARARRLRIHAGVPARAARARPGERGCPGAPIRAWRSGPDQRIASRAAGWANCAAGLRRLGSLPSPPLKAALQPAAPDVTTAAACMCRSCPALHQPQVHRKAGEPPAELRCSFRIRLARCFSTVLALRLR